jgi:hypothetical protein
LIATFLVAAIAAIASDSTLPMLATLIGAPWIALCLVSVFKPALSAWGDQPNSMEPALIVPGIALAAIATKAATPFDWQSPLALSLLGAISLAGALALTVAIPIADPENRPRRLALIFAVALLCPYGFGTGMVIDMEFDAAQPRIYTPDILNKHIVAWRGRSGMHYSRYLTLAPWGNQSMGRDEQVTKDLYDRVKVGDKLCMGLHPGALKIPWYAPTTCPAAS